MAISKVLLRVLIAINCFVCFRGVVANAAVASDQKLTGVSFSDLSDLFGGINITSTGDEDDNEKRQDIERLVAILHQSPDKIAPLLRKIEEAFGTTSEDAPATRLPALGLLEVTGIPPAIVGLRKRLLPRASELAKLPSEELRALEKPETGYSIGWSHGRESFRVDTNETESGAPKRRYDTAKGSFYMNPFADASTTNVYPPSLQPNFEEDLLKMTRFMSEVGLWIAILCDIYLGVNSNSHCPREQECAPTDNPERGFTSSISTNQLTVYKSLKYGKSAAKARLLYYFPQGQQRKENQEISTQIDNNNVFDDWCGWHTDHGTLTALLPGMLDGVNGRQQDDMDPKKQFSASSSSPKPGLYIKTKTSVSVAEDSNDIVRGQQSQHVRERLVHVDLAPDSLGFQLGETLEILSGGKFEATPHAVKAPPSTTRSMGRASLAVFLQPLASQVMPPLAMSTTSDRGQGESDDNHSRENDYDDAFSLRNRWRSTFGEFQRVTIESFS